MIAGNLAGGAAITSPSQDYPVSEITDAFLKDAWYQNAIAISVETDTGASSKDSSTLDLFDFISGSPSPFTTPGDSYIFKSGMGNFIQSLANGLPVKLNTIVQRISRTGSGVTVATNKGTFTAKTAIVTVSTGVLGQNAIEFTPKLPLATREAIAALPLGVAKFWGYNIVEFLADAGHAKKIESMSAAGQARYLLGRLEQNVPGAAAAYDGRFTGSNWGNDTFTYGSYSHARVGKTEARTALRKAVANQIYFAGEAVAQTTSITLLQGAYNSGIAAASGALKAIGVSVRVPA
jgi:monoamine oxidase